MPDLSRNLVHLRWLLKLIDFRVVEPFGELCWNTYRSSRYTASIRLTVGRAFSMDTIGGSDNSGSNFG
ncbi:hypothetical protein Goshw_021931 [Gossypium schwendimanii]|uniref:Uncharacterized protein n=1 Tax=Gossypium schwendimanii TaxID=34291 RepID=A0A7J9MJN9_GOSSC|nr:hypothetical protein [Gossypium schwendimanii]